MNPSLLLEKWRLLEHRDHTAPTPTRIAFQFFGLEIHEVVRRERPELDVRGLLAEICRRWEQMTAEQRQPYEALAAADETRYREEMESSFPRRRKKTDAAAPTRPLSAYAQFAKSVRTEYPNTRATEIAQLIAERWRALPEEERIAYQQRHASATAEYEIALRTYLAAELALDHNTNDLRALWKYGWPSSYSTIDLKGNGDPTRN